MEVVVLVPIWKRAYITKIWAENMRNFQTESIRVLCILSKDDPELEENYKLIKDFDICYFKNKPLGEKLNAGIEYALDNFKFDFLMNLGSDDLIHPALLSLYHNTNERFFGLEKVYFFNILTKEIMLTKPYLWGAGRMIHRDILDHIQKSGQFLYDNKYSRGLDCNSIDRIKQMMNIDYKQIFTNDFPFIVDLKSEVGINDYYLMQRMCDPCDQDILKRFYSKNVINMIYG